MKRRTVQLVILGVFIGIVHWLVGWLVSYLMYTKLSNNGGSSGRENSLNPHPIPYDTPMRLFCVESRSVTGSFMRRNGNEMVCNGNESKADEVYTNIIASPFMGYARLTLEDPQSDKKEYVITCDGANNPLTVQHVIKGQTPSKNDESLFNRNIQFYSYNMFKCKSPGGTDKGRKDLYVSSDTQGKTSLASITNVGQYPPPSTFIRIVQHL